MSAPSGDQPLARSGGHRFDRPKQLMQAPGISAPRTHAVSTVKLSEILEVLRRRWWLLGGGALLGLVLAGLWVLGEVSLYRATAVLRVGEVREAVTSGIEAPVGQPDRYVNPLTSQVQLIRSRSLIGEVVDSVGFRLRPENGGLLPGLLEAVHVSADATVDTLWLEFGPDGYSVRTRHATRRGVYGQPLEVDGVHLVLSGQPPSERAIWRVTSRDRAVDALLSKLRVSARNETNVVDVSFDHADPVTAQLVVNTLVTRYQAFDAQFAQERARRRRIFFEEQLAQTDASLAQAERVLTAFRRRAQTYDAREEIAAQQQNRMVLEIRREELDADRRMFQTLLGRLDGSTDGGRWEALRTLVSSPGIAENPVVSQLHQQVLRYRTSLDSLTTGVFGNAGTNPDVQRLRELIAGGEEELISAIRSHLASLDARADALEELSSRMAAEMALLPPQLAEEARLAQIVQTYRKMGDQLREEYQKAGMAEAVAVGQADIIDLAARPYQPMSRMGTLKLALGLLMGLALGGGGAFLLELRNSSVRRREQVEALFDLPLLGVIPHASGLDLVETAWRPLPSNGTGGGEPASASFEEPDGFGEELEGAAIGEPNGAGDEPDGIAVAETDAAEIGESGGPGDVEVEQPPLVLARNGTYASEAYRMLRTNLLFGVAARGVKSLMVTSTAPREGKTLTAIHLAASIAEEGPRVLLVDGDLWRGRIHSMARVPEAPGLAEMLAGEATADDAVRSTGVSRLFLLPRGRIHPSPSSLTRSTEVRRVLHRFSEEFDVIIVDGPPVLATASGPALASVVDGVMLVIRAGRTDRDAVREALRELGTVGARVVGAVLNDPSGITFSAEKQYYYAYARP